MRQQPRTRLDREARRTQIIEAAASVFHGRDPAEVTFEEIADAAGVSRALVYNYFGDRRGLLEAIHEVHHAALVERTNAALSSTLGRRQAIGAVVRVHLDFASTDTGSYRAAIGLNMLPHQPHLAEARIADFSKLLGGSERALMVATGALHALQAMVLRAVEYPGLPREEAAEVIASVTIATLGTREELDLPFIPWWDVPQPV